MKTVIINAVIAIVVVMLAVYSVLAHIEGTYATKEELAPFAEKEGLNQFITERALEPYARKEQLIGLAFLPPTSLTAQTQRMRTWMVLLCTTTTFLRRRLREDGFGV